MSQRFDQAVEALERVFEDWPSHGSGWVVTREGGTPALHASPLDISLTDLQTIGEELESAPDDAGWTLAERISGLAALTRFVFSWQAVEGRLQYELKNLKLLVNVLSPLKGR